MSDIKSNDLSHIFKDSQRLAQKSPYTFTIQYPPSREYFRQYFRQNPEPDNFKNYRDILLYIHVPFCAQRCFYCNFAVDLRKNEDLHTRYVNVLCEQLLRLEKAYDGQISIGGLDIGGGTPTQISLPLLNRLTEAVQPWLKRASVDDPASIETTPYIAANEPEKLQLLSDTGFSRISAGLQSTNEKTLADVNRRLQQNLAERAVRNMQDAKFKRISVDLVFGLPGQTYLHFKEDLKRVIALGVDTVTTYDCLYRGEGRILPKLRKDWPTPVQYARLYDMAYDMLTDAGYHAYYGGLNFSRHHLETGTSPYFEGRLLDGLPYIGTGNYASSLLGEYWFFAPYEVDDYLAKMTDKDCILPLGDSYALPAYERMAKYILSSLHFGFIDPDRFKNIFQLDFEPLFQKSLQKACAKGWLYKHKNIYQIKDHQFEHIYKLRALFYSPEAIRWLKTHDDLLMVKSE